MSMVEQNNPALATALRNNDVPRIVEHLRATAERQRQHDAELARLEADPLNPDNQRRIQELIRQEQINENLNNAMEHNPAAFGRVCMLYVDAKVNNVPVKAFVDSGAQMTIMSARTARHCNIEHLIDRNWSGVATGVGTSKIVGRVVRWPAHTAPLCRRLSLARSQHLVPMELGGVTFPCTFTILENQDIDFLFGLDMLKAHQGVINLRTNQLSLGDDVSVPFLAEKVRLPPHADALTRSTFDRIYQSRTHLIPAPTWLLTQPPTPTVTPQQQQPPPPAQTQNFRPNPLQRSRRLESRANKQLAF